MKKNKLLIGLVALTLSLVNLSSCANEERHSINGNVDESYWGDVENHISSEDPWDVSSPNVNITEIGSGQIGQHSSNEGGDAYTSIEGTIDHDTTVYDMVYRNVQYTLEEAGFTTMLGGASEIHDVSTPKGMKRALDPTTSETSLGIIYYRDDFNLFDNANYYSAGFYEIVNKEEKANSFESDSEIYLQAINDTTPYDYLCAYSYDNIGYDHFIFNNKYITYHCRNDKVIEYQEYPNEKKYYNTNFGNLYDYDNGELIYDESLFDGYLPHNSATSLFEKVDYNKLQEEIKNVVATQNTNGYKVDEVNLVYISPEAIEEYLISEETDTFFGYDVKELTSTLGEGNACTWQDGQLVVAPVPNDEPTFNWKSFVTKIVAGAAIILVGAALTPLTGGASFGCALMTIVKGAVTFAVTSALTELVTSTARGLGEGKSFFSALGDSFGGAANKFADGFFVGAAITSVGVVSGIIKPIACFEAGTLVASYELGQKKYKPIEDVRVGDMVVSYNQETHQKEVNLVTDTSVNQVDKILTINVGDEEINTTLYHPFFDKEENAWIEASFLKPGDEVYTLDGELLKIDEVTISYLDEPVNVYNFTVDNAHTYYVGRNDVLVHNSCKNITNNNLDTSKDSLFKKLKDKVLKKVADKNEEIKYGLPKDFMDFIKGKGKFPEDFTDGVGGHIKDALKPKDIYKAFKEGLATKKKAEEMNNDPNIETTYVDRKNYKEMIVSFIKEGKEKLESVKINTNISDYLMKLLEG